MSAGSSVPDNAIQQQTTVESSALVDADPDVVWALVTDIHLPTTFTAELEEAEWIDGDQQPRVGARFVVCTRSETLGSRETVATITQCEPRRVFEWAIGDPSRPISTWHVVLEPVGGATRLTLSLRSGTGDHRRDVAAFLEGIGGLATRLTGQPACDGTASQSSCHAKNVTASASSAARRCTGLPTP